MAMIQGPGGFSHQPIQRQFKTGESGPTPSETGSPIADGFVRGGAEVPTHFPTEVRIQTPAEVAHQAPVEIPQPGAATVPTRFETDATPRIPAEFEGAFLTGPGMTGLHSLSSIGSAPANAGISEFAFTNGLSSTKLVSLGGRTLADLSPFKS